MNHDPASRSRAIRLILGVCTIEALGMTAFATFPTLIPDFQHAWRINNTEAGWISGVYFAGYVAAVAILTALTDRVDAKRIYLASMALSALSALGFALGADGVWSASLWRLLQGVGLAGTYMPGLKLLADALPDRLQSRGTAFYTASFGVGASLSYFVSGQLGTAFGWQWAFALCSVGPGLALLLAAFVLERSPPPTERLATRLLDLRPVLANRPALGFTLAYTAHNTELFAFRSWIVAFLVFSQAQQPGGATGALWSAATLAALINLVAVPSSILGNELALRVGRRRTAIAVMLSSSLVGMLFGFSAAWPFVLVVALSLVYGITIAGESATVTAGVVRVAERRYRGTTMAMHSVIGFVGAFLGPVVFGAVLDLAGGASVGHAWGLAFASMGVILLLGPLALVRFVGVEGAHD